MHKFANYVRTLVSIKQFCLSFNACYYSVTLILLDLLSCVLNVCNTTDFPILLSLLNFKIISIWHFPFCRGHTRWSQGIRVSRICVIYIGLLYIYIGYICWFLEAWIMGASLSYLLIALWINLWQLMPAQFVQTAWRTCQFAAYNRGCRSLFFCFWNGMQI